MIINIFKRNGTKTRNGNTSIYSTRNNFFLNRNTQSPRQETKIRSLWWIQILYSAQKTNHEIISASGILVHTPSFAFLTQIQNFRVDFFPVIILYLSACSGCMDKAQRLASTFFRSGTNFRLRTSCSLERISWGGGVFSFSQLKQQFSGFINHFSCFGQIPDSIRNWPRVRRA